MLFQNEITEQINQYIFNTKPIKTFRSAHTILVIELSNCRKPQKNAK